MAKFHGMPYMCITGRGTVLLTEHLFSVAPKVQMNPIFLENTQSIRLFRGFLFQQQEKQFRRMSGFRISQSSDSPRKIHHQISHTRVPLSRSLKISMQFMLSDKQARHSRQDTEPTSNDENTVHSFHIILPHRLSPLNRQAPDLV